ncbi:MAG: ABC transporter permease [Opitutus sp.]
MTLRLYARDRMSLLYGLLFPVIFLGAFWALYRHETIPLRLHLGELLTVTALGGACFGLPTTLVSERERGVWLRYRMTPLSPAQLLTSTLVARFIIVVTAGALQFGLAALIGMSAPSHPAELAAAYTLVTATFIALGLVIAALADSVPAVQALGQCLFLPMLILGGIAVPIASLPLWAQDLSAFLPGGYAVDVLQACVDGSGFSATRFGLLALALIGVAAFVVGVRLFRWAAGQRFRTVAGKAWLIPLLASCALVGVFAQGGEPRSAGKPPSKTSAPAVSNPARPLEPWERLTDAQINAINFSVPSDDGRVTPIARDEETPDDATDLTLAKLEGELPHWMPGHVADPVQRARNLLSVAAVVDLMQNPIERFVPALVQQKIVADLPNEQAARLLAWIALHPGEGTVISNLSELHLQGVASEAVVRERVQLYAIKLLARITGRQTTAK